MIQIASFPPSLALTRLKSNLFFLFLALFFQHVFTPYRTIRHGLVWALDERMGVRLAGEMVSWAERGVMLVLGANILHAAWSLHSPPPPGKVTVGRTVTPSKPSSPLTRSYPPAPPRESISSPSPLSQSTATVTATPQRTSGLSQRYATPGNQLQTPTRAPRSPQNGSSAPPHPSPLSASTAQLLNLPHDTTPSKSGFYYQQVKKENGEDEIHLATSVPGGSAGGEFVVVNPEEREWVDNAWKGVRGKGGKVGL